MALSRLCFTQLRTIFHSCPNQNVNFFARYRQDELWKTATSVSPGGKKKGRGIQTRQRKKMLEKFYEFGRSPLKVSFPGLDGRVDDFPREPIEIRLDEDNKLIDPLAAIRDKIAIEPKRQKRRPREKLYPLERGFSGQSLLGQKLGPPPPYQDMNFEGFETYCLMMNRTCRMTKAYGRVFTVQALVITGNGKGLFGYGVGKAPFFKRNDAIVDGMKCASRRLLHIDLLENRTIFQDFFAESRNTRVFAQRCAEGFGVVCHQRLQKMCELIGIKDIYVKVEGTTSKYKYLVYAFLTGLVNQETFEALAERKRMHVVEMKAGRQYFPEIIASPKKATVKRNHEIDQRDRLKLDHFYGEGRMPLRKQPRMPFWEFSDKHQLAEWRKYPYRNMEKVMIRLLADDVLPRWTRTEREAVGIREHELVMSGQMPMPRGIGLSGVYPKSAEEED